MEIERCSYCEGRKKIIGLGMIEKKCEECNGIGYKEKPEKKSPKRRKKKAVDNVAA